MKLNFELIDTINIAIEINIFHFCSLSDNSLNLPKRYKKNITVDEQIWNSWGFAVEARNKIIGEVSAKRK